MSSQLPSQAELKTLFDQKYAHRHVSGWAPQQRERFAYFSPDDYYEAVLCKLIKNGDKWADIGCGRDIFPSNVKLAKALAGKCRNVTGIDPDPNILENEFLTDAHRSRIEDFVSDQRFDIVTLRMVAEHITNPSATIDVLSKITDKGARVVVYTPHKWAPVSIIARMTPMSFHHRVKTILWQTEEKDTFPVAYRMNTRRELKGYFTAAGFEEDRYWLIDDCRVFSNFRTLNYIDLRFWQICRTIRLPYPEKCILAIYRRL